MAERNHAKKLGKRNKGRTPGPAAGGGGSLASGGLNWSRTLNPRSKGRASKPRATPVCLELAADLDEMKDAAVRAKLACDSYDAYDPTLANGGKPPAPPPGFTRVSDDPAEMRKLLPGLSNEQIKYFTRPDGSSYRATVYKDANGKVFLAFRGTAENADWKESIPQGAGAGSEHYERAKELAALLAESVGPENMEIVGHSKGGGMAAAAGITTGVKTTTFNAAGVHPNTVKGFDVGKASENVKSYVVDGEILNWAQEDVRTGILAGAVGVAAGLAAGAAALLGLAVPVVGAVVGGAAMAALKGALPPSVGKRTALPALWDDAGETGKHDSISDRVTLHKMPKVIAGVEARTATLRKDYEANGCPAQLGQR